MIAVPECRDLIGTLAAMLTRAGFRLATAESCTGGLVAAACTDMAGSSDWFNGGVVSYANELKAALLRVPEETIARRGAVSEDVVRHMAANVLEVCGAQAGIAVSGVAGPSGGTKEKPVGTVWIAWSLRKADGAVSVRAARHNFSGGRADVRRAAVLAALRGMVSLLQEEGPASQ